MIGFVPCCHTLSTTSFCLTSLLYQHHQHQFQPVVTGCQCISNNSTANTTLLAQNDCDFSKLLFLLSNLSPKNDRLISLKNFYYDITLSLVASIGQSFPILLELHNLDPSKYLLHLLFPSMVKHSRDKSCQAHIIMSQAPSKSIPNTTLQPAAPLAYNTLQHVIAKEDC